jgi:hypothetical protein
MMIAIAVEFPWRTPHAAAHIVFSLSNVAQSLLSSSLPLPLSPAAKEGGLPLSLSMLMHHHWRGLEAASLPAPCDGRRPPTPMPFEGGVHWSILVPPAANRKSGNGSGTTNVRCGPAGVGAGVGRGYVHHPPLCAPCVGRSHFGSHGHVKIVATNA